MEHHIRALVPSDIPAIYRICLLTGSNGLDASAEFSDPDLLGHFFAGPYALLRPETCLVLEAGGIIAGYVIGCADTESFIRDCELDWFPPLRKRYAGWPGVTDADRNLAGMIVQGMTVPEGIQEFPSHLHIDLLPSAQGSGMGKKMLDAIMDVLEAKKSPGVHLGVSRANQKAVAFYQKYGFRLLAEHPGWLLMGLELPRRRSLPGAS